MGIKAITHKKLSRIETSAAERVEDLLTSCLFQNVSYLPIDEGLTKILYSSVNINKKRFPCTDIPISATARYLFWPRINNTEPDLIVELVQNEKVSVAILFEMKLDSPLSGRDQLKREYDLLEGKYPDAKKFLVYITRSVFPAADIEESEKLIGSEGVIFHTNYREISFVLRDNRDQASIDIQELLAHYGFSAFFGWKATCYEAVFPIGRRFSNYRRRAWNTLDKEIIYERRVYERQFR